MIDFDSARRQMVDTQIRPNGVSNYAVIEQFLQVPREKFVHSDQVALAYMDNNVEVARVNAKSRSIMNPMVLAKLVQFAQIKPHDFVLDIGCATGYSSAILSGLAQSVIALESHVDLADNATNILQELGHDNVAVVTGPLNEGYSSEAPFDVIFIGGGVEQVPQTLLSQLREGGRLVAVMGRGPSSYAVKYIKTGDVISATKSFNATADLLLDFSEKAEFVF